MSKTVDLSEFRKVKKTVCRTSQLIGKLSAEDKEKIEAALAEPTISSQAICDWLSSKTGEVSKNPTLRLHRLGKCACD